MEERKRKKEKRKKKGRKKEGEIRIGRQNFQCILVILIRISMGSNRSIRKVIGSSGKQLISGGKYTTCTTNSKRTGPLINKYVLYCARPKLRIVNLLYLNFLKVGAD